MKLTLVLTGVIIAAAFAQTPLEFGIVQDLVGGTPRVSVYSIKTVSEGGVTSLQIAARAGVYFNCTRHAMITDTMTADQVLIDGQVCYSASIMNPIVEHLFTVVRNRMGIHGSGGITSLQVDLITSDEMGWISVTIPLSRVDSLLAGSLTHLDFWAQTPVREIEVGTLGFPVINESPLPELHGAPDIPERISMVTSESGCAWKSLVFPGWGQMCAGEGLPWVNFIIEAGGVALLFSEDYREAGIGILSVNHLISFTDLL